MTQRYFLSEAEAMKNKKVKVGMTVASKAGGFAVISGVYADCVDPSDSPKQYAVCVRLIVKSEEGLTEKDRTGSEARFMQYQDLCRWESDLQEKYVPVTIHEWG